MINKNKSALLRAILSIFLLAGIALSIAHASVAVSPLFSANMVLQRNKPVPVFGTANASESVTVTFNAQSVSTTADSQGDWHVDLAPMGVNATAQTMTITGTNTISITGVLIGDVWLISGQSNMTMPLSASGQTADETSANFPGIRRFSVGQVDLTYPTKSLTGSWTVCSPSTAPSFPATGFYFARKIYQDQGGTIPIGLIQAARGSTNIDVWPSQESLASIPLLQPLLNPSTASWPPFCFFNGMIYPLEPYAIYGVIWWQGCTREGTSQSVDSYYVKERAVIQGWRQLWGGEEFPFYIVQLANYEAEATGVTPDLKATSRADTRLQQANVLGLPRTGMAVAIDVGDATNIHPPDKYDIGERLALWALKNDYGRTSIVESGPIFKDATVSGSTLICSFDYIGTGLMVGSKVQYQPTQEVIGGTLTRFSIAGADGVWYGANAVITGNTVVVSSPSVATPTKVAYAHWPNPTGCNLYNKQGLPASPFFVDDVNAKYTLTATAGTGGTITPAGATTHLKRTTALYTITPDSGYYILDVKVDGVSVGAVQHYTFDPLYANHTIAATFTATCPTYTVTATAGAGGSLSQSGALSVVQGASKAFKIVPNTGCYVDTVTVDGVAVGNRTSFTFADVRTNHTIAASFECKITATIGYGGAITPGGVTDIPYGTSKTFAITPKPGFTTTNVTVDGVSQGVVTSYTFNNVTGPHTISATFSGGGGTQDGVPRIYDLLFSVNTDSLPASGNTGNWASYIPSGKTLTKIGTPSVEVLNGVKWEKNVFSDYDGYNYGSYSLPIVNAGASIVMAIRPLLDTTNSAYLHGVAIFNDRLVLGFKANTGQVFVNRNGTTNTSTTTIPDGQVTILSMVTQPNGTYKVWANGTQIMNITTVSDITNSLVPNGNSNCVTLGASPTTGANTFNGNIGDTFAYLVPLSDTERQTLETSLASKFAGGSVTNYTITSYAGSGGSISPSGGVIVSEGATKSFSITPSGGYVIADVKVDNISVGAVAAYTFTGVAANHTISATFSAVPALTITASAGTGGTISPSGAVLVNTGGNQTFSITPAVGYAIADVKVDNVTVGAVASYTFTSVSANHSIAAIFIALPPLTINAAAEVGGSISPVGAVSVSSGANQTFTITPNAGYAIEEVEVDDTSIGVVSSYTFNNVTANHIINARFSAVPPLTITASAGSGGSISPSGPVSVNHGASQTFVITPNRDYAISDVFVDNVSAGAVTSYTFSNVTSNHTISATFSSGGIPKTDQLVKSWISDNLPASGSTGNLSSYLPSGETFIKMGSPTVDTINGVKWINNHRSSGDGFDLGLFASTTAIPCSGASIVMAVKPLRDGISSDWISCFSVFTYTLSFGVRNDTGNICARRNSTLYNYPTAIIPDGQITILSLIVQPDGKFKVYANGTQIVSESATSAFTQIAPTWSTSDSQRHMNLGRANGATWSCFNGDIGDTYFYKVALTDAERRQLEAQLTAKFIPPTYQDVANITALKSKEGQLVRLTSSAVVTFAPRQSDNTRSTTFFYIGEAQGKGCIKIIDNTSDDLMLGKSISGLIGTVSKSAATGEYELTLTSDPVGNGTNTSAVIGPLGLNNKSAFVDEKILTNLVKIWGKVQSINGLTSFVINDGFDPNGIPVIGNGISLPVGFDTTKTAVVMGILTKDSTGARVILAQEVATP